MLFRSKNTENISQLIQDNRNSRLNGESNDINDEDSISPIKQMNRNAKLNNDDDDYDDNDDGGDCCGKGNVQTSPADTLSSKPCDENGKQKENSALAIC